MKKTSIYVTSGAALVLGLLAVAIAGYSPQKGTSVDYEDLAQKLVTQSANIQEGDLVRISGGVRNLELLENIAVQVRKLAAFPLVTLSSERMDRRYYDEVPAKYDSQTPEFDVKLATMITAWISVDFGETPDLLADVPAERRAAVAKTFQPVDDLLIARSVRQVNLGNALYPTTARAKLFGVSQGELAKVFWDGVNVDYSELKNIGEAVQTKLANGKELHITNSNGTNLKVRIEARPVFVSDGVISDADMQKGGAACQVWLPAGEVYLTPVPGTAKGKVVVDRQFYQGKEIRGLALTFEAGKLTSMKAKSGLEPLKARYAAAGRGRDVFAFIDLGISPNVQIIPDSRMVAWMTSGMITVGIGNNTWAGGENEANYFMANFLPGSTLKVDGKLLVENGALKP